MSGYSLHLFYYIIFHILYISYIKINFTCMKVPSYVKIDK